MQQVRDAAELLDLIPAHLESVARYMAEERQSIHKPESRNLRKLFTAVLPLLFLAIPSLWLIWSVPPLWKDVDAYNQTVRPPGLVTILLHGPLYCTLSRVPLWFGYLISGSGPAASLGHFIKHSQLTDAGVYSLVVLQHIALWCGAVYLIYAIARTLLLFVPDRIFVRTT